jgi:phosphatidylinositol glycan class S
VTGTLNSLYELLEEQTHMPVEDTIQHSVQHAFDKFRAAIAGATVGEYREGMVASRAALGSAKQAFFHPSMLPLLYFPDEHVYAVYAPFFLPIIVPVLGALLAYIKRIRKKSAKAKLK